MMICGPATYNPPKVEGKEASEWLFEYIVQVLSGMVSELLMCQVSRQTLVLIAKRPSMFGLVCSMAGHGCGV
jgi:hypothetical protein